MSAGGAQSHGTRAPAPIVGNVAVGEVYPLRRDVLRNGDPQAIVEFAEDRWPGVVHLAVFVGSSIVAVSTWIPRPLPAGSEASKRGLNAASAVQLRGMATAASHRGSGIGGVLVEEGCSRVGVSSPTSAGPPLVVWARARDAALAFYSRHSFEVAGEGFVDVTTGLPHHLVIRRLA